MRRHLAIEICLFALFQRALLLLIISLLYTFLFIHYIVVHNYSLYQFTAPLILLKLKKISVQSVYDVSSSNLNAGEALGKRIDNTQSLHVNEFGVRMH